MTISLEQMKAITRRFAIEPWGNGNLAVLDEVCAPNYVLEFDQGTGDLEALKAGIREARRATPDLRCEIKEMIAEGDMVAYRWVMTGTHWGEYKGIAATGKTIKFTGITIVQFADGKICHDTFQSSSPSLEQQIA